MQCNLPLPRIFLWLAEGVLTVIVCVAGDGEAPRGGLHANLMGAAGFQFDLQPGTPIVLPHDSIVQYGVFGCRVVSGDDLRLRYAVTLVEVVGPGSFVGRDVPLNERPVGFAHRPVCKLGADPLSCADMPGKDEGPCRGPIHAMGDAKVDIRVGRLSLLQAIIILNADLHAVDAARGLREHSGGFVHNQARSIFVEDFQLTG